MKRITTIIIGLFSLLSSAQKENIELPKTEGFEIKYSSRSITPTFSVYVNKDKEVYFEKIKLNNSLQLADTINKYRSKLRPERFTIFLLLLHADKDLPYATVDSVKSALSSVHVGRIFYRTNHIEDITSAIGRRNQASMNYKGLIQPGGTEVVDVYSKKLPSGIGKHPIEHLIDELYSLNLQSVKESLVKFTYKNIEFVNGTHLMINNQKVSFSDDERIYQEIKDLDFYFFSSDHKLSYDDYIKSVTVILNVLKKHKFDTPGIEISNRLKIALAKEHFKL